MTDKIKLAIGALVGFLIGIKIMFSITPCYYCAKEKGGIHTGENVVCIRHLHCWAAKK